MIIVFAIIAVSLKVPHRAQKTPLLSILTILKHEEGGGGEEAGYLCKVRLVYIR